MQIIKGDTFRDVLRWSTSECVLISATVVPGAPVRLNAPAHGLVDGWRVSIDSSQDFSPSQRHVVSVVDANTIELPCVNGLSFRPRAAAIKYRKPTDLAGYAAIMEICDSSTGDVLLTLTSDAPDGDPRIIIDDADKTIRREIPASVTAAIDWSTAEYRLRMHVVADPDDVTTIDSGRVCVKLPGC